MNSLGAIVKEEVQQVLVPIARRSIQSQRRRTFVPRFRREDDYTSYAPRTSDQWRTVDNQPICFHCGKPGHVLRYCRERRRTFEDARLRRTLPADDNATPQRPYDFPTLPRPGGFSRSASSYPGIGRMPRRRSQSPRAGTTKLDQKIEAMIDSNFTEDQQNKMMNILKKFSNVFDFSEKSQPARSKIKHKIDTGDHAPTKQMPYRVSGMERKIIQQEVDRIMKQDIIQFSESPWSSPVVLVKKKNGSWRFCVDYRRLNKITKKDVYPLARVDDVSDNLSGARYYLMVYGPSFEEHLKSLEVVLECLQQSGLNVNHEKCLFGSRQLKILGHVVNENGIHPDPEKVEAILKFPSPKIIPDIRSFLGLCSYYKRFVKTLSHKAKPLNDLLKNDVKLCWNKEKENAFEILKEALTSEPVLGHFIEDAEIHIHTDASGYGIGAVLIQIQGGAERPIAYESRTLTKAEKNYSTTEKELLAVVWAPPNLDPTFLAEISQLLQIIRCAGLQDSNILPDDSLDGHSGCKNLTSPECQRRKSVPQRPPGQPLPIPPANFPFQKIRMDLLGRFPVTIQGNKWIIVCTEYMTRFATTKAGAGAFQTQEPWKLLSLLPKKLFSDTELLSRSSLRSIIVERFMFFGRIQKETESVSEYLVEIKRLASTCGFGEFLKESLRDKLVCGLRNAKIQRRILSEGDVPLARVVEIALSMEAAEKNTRIFHVNEPADSVDKIRGEVRNRYDREQKRKCIHCGRLHKDLCRFREATCFRCGKRGHLATICRSREKHTSERQVSRFLNQRKINHIEDQEEEEEESVQRMVFIRTYDYRVKYATNDPPYVIKVRVEDTLMTFEIDTGSCLTLISEKDFKRYFPDVQVKEAGIIVKTYDGTVVPILGEIDVKVDFRGTIAKLRAVVVRGERKALLGREWINVLKIGNYFVNQMPLEDTLAELLSEHQVVFGETTDPIKGFTFAVNIQDVNPIFHKARPVPFAIRTAVNEVLERMVEKDYLYQVPSSKWATPVVVVPKKNKVFRICCDFKVTLNRFLDTAAYPLPTQQDLFSVLARGKYFSKLDLSNAYLQLEVNPSTQPLLTINMHKGLFRFKRMPFGLANAPSFFQSFMDRILAGINGVICYIDDVLVSTASVEEHIAVLKTIFVRLQKHNIKLKREKCEFLRREIQYLGHLIKEDGIRPLDDKIQGLQKAKSPTNVSELRSFLGLVNYYGKFIPNLPELLEPLHKLLKKNSCWKWTGECEEAISECKKIITSEKVLVPYDATLPLSLATDASQIGVGAVLSHVIEVQEKPIMFASRTLSGAERNYSQIEREALAIIYDNDELTSTARYISTPETIPKIDIQLEPSPTTKIMLPSSPTHNHTPQISPQSSALLSNCDNAKLENRMVETRSGKMQDPAQERIQAEESAKPQPGATIGRDASSDPVVLNPNIDIPKYDGTEDPRPWIESLEEIGFLYHWADYIISRYAAMNMTGSAKTWLNLHKASFTSWENIKIRLIQDFSLDANKEELRMKLNRMQHWNEPAIRFAEDILVLCNKVDPAMEEETKIEHVIGGLKKEYSFALYLNPPKTTDDLLVVCKKMDSFEKKYRERVEKSRNLYNGPRYSRPQQQSRYVPPTAARNYQTTSRPQAPVSNNYKNDSPPTPRQYRNNFPQPSTPRRPYNPNFVPKPNLQRNTYNKSQEVSKNRTEDGRPICFKCNKPGHVARYCRVKFIRILEEDPADTQEKVEEKCQMNEISEKSGPRLYADIGTFEALVDTGADLSVVDLRTALDTGHGISKLAKICAGPDGKKLDMVGNIFLNIKIDDETLSHNFVILKTHLRTLILGRDFLKKMNAKIDCKQETIKYDLTNNHDEINFEMLKIKSAKDSIVPECSMKLIKALVETEDGEYIIEESSKMFQTNGLRLARSLINVINRETHIWITNPYPRPLKIMKNQTLAFGSSPAKINVSREREVEKNEEPRFQINENLSPKEQKELKQVLERYGDLFSSRLGRTNLAKHRIDTEDAKPIKHKPYRVSAKERDIIKEQIDEMLTEGIIRPSSSPWSFPVILVKKRDGKYRFCVDYRKLNNVTVKDVYPIPRIDEVMDTLQGSTHFSAKYLRSGYWQVEVEERDKEKTAFTTAHGLYEFNVMPFGLCNAPATFERNMENMLGNLRWQICLCFLDDVIIYSPDFPTHLKRLEAVFRCFRESNLRLNDKKCRFAFEELEILGYITSKHGIKPAEHNIKAVRNFPRPKKVKEVQSFLGMCSYYRKFIKDFSKIADPLTNLIKKSVSFTWTERQEEAFQTLKTALLSPPILGHINPNAPTYVHTDASNIGIGATLVQDIGGEEKVISYLSRTLSKAEQNYSTTEKECLAVVWSMSKLRPYLYGRHFKIVTDHHALCWLKNLKDPTGRLARWALKIQEYDFDIIHKSGKKHLDADGLSRGPLPETDWDEDFERLFLNQITDEEDKFIESVKKNLNGKNKKREIMKEYHNHMSNGHLGVARTMYRIKSKYFWPSMLKDVSEFVKTCHLCQSRKGSNQLPSGLLQPIPPANFPFERIGIDFVGPLPSTKNRKKWIIVLTDYYTRYAETRAVSEATVKEVSKFLVEDIFLRHGAPQYLISDRGSQFTSNLMKEVMKTCKIKHCFTTSYHPQTNGLTERLNRTLINMLSMYVNTDQKNWDEILPFITHAYNTTIQETTGYSPFFLMFGREPTSLLDDRNISVDIDKDDYDEYIKHHLDKINRTIKLVINNTINTQERMKKNYDKKHMERSYEPGELVAVWTPIRKIGKCEKLLRKYFGPYRILKKLSNVNYLIEPKDNPGQDPLIVHVSRLKPYFERIDEVTHED
ncbi:hypothetical protein LAZ67_16002094, partial [Cordylochernes scorpioides]